MNFFNSITSSNTYKRLSLQDYVFIIRKVTKYNSIYNGIKRNTGRTSLILDHPERIKGMTTISTKTFYTYVHAGLINIKPVHLPRTVQRKKQSNYKTYIPKRHKGTSIDHRPAHVLDRLEFGHWEGDLVTGLRNGQNGALLTLIERKTRFYYMIPVKDKSSKQVYMKLIHLHIYICLYNTIYGLFCNMNEKYMF